MDDPTGKIDVKLAKELAIKTGGGCGNFNQL